MSVIDASAVAEMLLGLPHADAAERQVFDADGGSAAPDLLNAEILHVLRRYERDGAIDARRSHEAIVILSDLPIARYPTLMLLERAWALRENMTGYDAMYVALAQALAVPLITTDGRLAKAARQHGDIPVVLLA